MEVPECVMPNEEMLSYTPSIKVVAIDPGPKLSSSRFLYEVEET